MNKDENQEIDRSGLLDIGFPKRDLSSVKAVQITFPPGQKAPLHSHPCPVVGIITCGTCLLQVKGKPEQVINAGESFYEPADTPITHFDNYSDNEPMIFVAFYLKDGEQELIELLSEEG